MCQKKAHLGVEAGMEVLRKDVVGTGAGAPP